jgi:hypothetical protein
VALLATIPPSFAAERAWALRILLERTLDVPLRVTVAEVPETRLSLDDEPGRLVLEDGLFGTRTATLLEPTSLPAGPVGWWDAGRELPDAVLCEPALPVLYGRPEAAGAWLRRVDEGLRLSADLVGGAFLLLSRLEEALPGPRDAHGRLPARASVAHREGFLDRPVVDEYAEVLARILVRLWPRLGRTRPEYRLVLSHDVDLPFCRDRTPRRAVGDVVTRRDPGLAGRRLAARLRPARVDEASDVCCTFERIMDAAEAAGVRSAFYFLCGGRGEPRNGSYALDEPRVRRVMRRIADRGHEIGLHPSYSTHDDPEATLAEFSRLREACARLGIDQGRWGGRQHYLRWSNPTTWRNWAGAGLDYDSTLTFADEPGFRCGTCRPYPAFDLVAREELPLVERPLVVMDGTLFDYRRLTPDQAVDAISHLAGRCRRVGGEFTLLWHNDRLITTAESRAFTRSLALAS